MNCENCQTALLDLVYDDLEESLEVQAREHIERCEACRLSYQKLSEAVSLAIQLPQLEPSERVSENIRKAAYRKSGIVPQPNDVTKMSLQERLRRLVGFVGHFAMGRQVAMAMVMLIIVAFGLHFLPHLRRTPKATGGTVVNPDGSGEAGPSSKLTPAKPFDLTLDFPRGRIRSKESLENDVHPKESVAAEKADHTRGARRGASLPKSNYVDQINKPTVADRSVDSYRDRRSRTDYPVAIRKRASSSDKGNYRDERLMAKSARDKIGLASEKESALGGASISASAAPAKSESKRKESDVSQNRSRQMQSEDEPLAFPYGNRPAPMQRRPKAPPKTAASTESETPYATGEAAFNESEESIETLFRRGVAQYQSGNYSSAISELTRIKNRDDAREFRPQTLFYLARSYRASAQFSLAVENYQLLIRGYPRHSRTGAAMLEAASCLRRLGRIEEARELLERASRIPSVAEQARRELISLE